MSLAFPAFFVGLVSCGYLRPLADSGALFKSLLDVLRRLTVQSIKYTSESEFKTLCSNSYSELPQPLLLNDMKEGGDVIYTYSAQWVSSSVEWPQRWRKLFFAL